MTDRVELLSDGIALRDTRGRKVGALRFAAEAGAVRVVVEGSLPPEFELSCAASAHLSGVGIEARVNAEQIERHGPAPHRELRPPGADHWRDAPILTR